MGRRHSLVWLALIGAAGLACALLLTIPFTTCPTCQGLEKHLRKASPSRMADDGFELGCPECSDRGTVTWVKSLRGSRLDARTQAVLQSVRGVGPTRAAHATAVALSSKDLQLFMGDFGAREPLVRIVFVHAEGRDHLVVLMESSWTTSSTCIGAALLPLDGNSTDYVQMDCDDWMDLKGTILKKEGPDGASIRIDLDTNGFRSDLKERVSCSIRSLGGGLRKQPVFLPLPAHPQGVCRLAIRGGRWQILTPAYLLSR